MKKSSLHISVLSIAFSMMFLVISTGAKGGMPEAHKKTLVSELNLESPGLLGPKSYSADGKDLKSNLLQGFLIPVKEGLKAFVDCASPLHQDGLTPKDAHTNYRAVIGFHFSLR